HRPFLEAQRTVAVGVELGEGLLARAEYFLGLDLAILVLVGAREPLFLAAPGAGLGRHERRGCREQRGRPRGGRSREARSMLGARLPDQEGARQQQERGGG